MYFIYSKQKKCILFIYIFVKFIINFRINALENYLASRNFYIVTYSINNIENYDVC